MHGKSNHTFGLSLILFSALCLGDVQAQNPEKAKPIRVACLDVYGQAEEAIGPKNLIRCLAGSPDFKFRTVSPGDVRSNVLAQVDVLICPGGSGSKQSKDLEEKGRVAIQEFVKAGGGYIGICAGAYLASSHYSWSLGLMNAKVVDTAHWARGTGDIVMKMTPEGRSLLGTTNDLVTCYYGQGPLLAPGTNTSLAAYQVLATYHTEIAKKAPPGVMIGTTAIATGTCGKGRVLLFSPHPEKTKGLEDYIKRASAWAAGKN